MPEMTILPMRFACSIHKATHTHTHTHVVYLIFIAFPLQQWLHERTSVLRYTCIVCLVYNRDSVYCSVRAETIIENQFNLRF